MSLDGYSFYVLLTISCEKEIRLKWNAGLNEIITKLLENEYIVQKGTEGDKPRYCITQKGREVIDMTKNKDKEMTILSNYEIQFLHSMNGEEVPGLRWGAAMSQALEDLWNAGFIACMTIGKKNVNYCLSERGKVLVKNTFLAYPLRGEGCSVFHLSRVDDLERREDGWWVRLRTHLGTLRRSSLSPLHAMLPDNKVWEGPFIIRDLPFNYNEKMKRYFPVL